MFNILKTGELMPGTLGENIQNSSSNNCLLTVVLINLCSLASSQGILLELSFFCLHAIATSWLSVHLLLVPH